MRSLLPKPRRKYEVDESKWLVIKGRAILKWLDTDARPHLRRLESGARALPAWAEVETRAARRGFALNWPAYRADFAFGIRRFGLTFRWKRVPRVWEMLFIDRMRAAERIGIPFIDVLRATLPKIIGIDGARVLGYWTGMRSLVDPEVFVREMEKLFGETSKLIVLGVFDNLDEGKMLVDNIPEESKLQSMMDAIRQSDEREIALAEMRATGKGAIIPSQQGQIQRLESEQGQIQRLE